MMHDTLTALRRVRDRDLSAMGFDRARSMGVLGSYMEMMNRGGSARYRREWIAAEKMRPGVVPLAKAKPPTRDPIAWCQEVAHPLAVSLGYGLTNYGTRWHRNGKYYDIPCFTGPDEVLRLLDTQWLEGARNTPEESRMRAGLARLSEKFLNDPDPEMRALGREIVLDGSA